MTESTPQSLSGSEIPKNWTTANIGDFLVFEYGKGLTKNARDPSGDVPVYGSSGVAGYHTEPLIDEPCLIVGRKGAAGAVHISHVPAWTIDTAYFIRVPNGFDIQFLYYLLSIAQLNHLDKSTAVPSLSRDDAYAVQVKFPSTNEQKRIVEKLEQLLSELDKAVDALKTAQEKLKTYRRAVLKAAVEGELSSVWREENKERLEPAVNDSLKPNVLDVGENTTGLPQLPDKWVWLQLSQVSDALGGFAFKSSDYTDEGFQIVKIGNVGKESLKLSVKPSFINEVDNKIVEKYSLKTNDVVISLTGTRFKRDYGHPIMIESHGKLLLNQRVARLRFHKKLDPKYCQIALASEQFQNQFFSYETGNVGQGNVGMNALRETYIALPPFEEQVVIRDAVDAHNSVTENLQNILTQALQKSQRLRQAILQKAFSGLLVPQDPNDEPASVLLERIRAEREAAGADKGKRGKKKTADDPQPRLLEVDA